jgi:hypothetical protein
MPLWFSKIWSVIKNYQIKALDVLKKKVSTILRKWRKVMLLGLGVLGLLWLIILVLVIHHNANLKSNSSRELINAFKPLSIPPEDLFPPDEPDFLPDILLEREPRNPWTAEDVRPFWKDPLHEEPEPWREEIKTVIDELLEGVP